MFSRNNYKHYPKTAPALLALGSIICITMGLGYWATFDWVNPIYSTLLNYIIKEPIKHEFNVGFVMVTILLGIMFMVGAISYKRKHSR